MTKRIWIPQAISIPLLVWALVPVNPYGYYILLRIICCTCFAYLAISAFRRKEEGFGWVLGATALVYNPILPVHLNRELWSLINIATIAICMIALAKLKANGEDTLPK
jgi:hypothetical protein